MGRSRREEGMKVCSFCDAEMFLIRTANLDATWNSLAISVSICFTDLQTESHSNCFELFQSPLQSLLRTIPSFIYLSEYYFNFLGEQNLVK